MINMTTLPLPKERNLFFIKQFDQASVGELTKSIIDINGNDEYLIKLYDLHGLNYIPKPIRIHIDSFGGVLIPCLGLISVIEKSKTPIHTICVGGGISCGFLTLIVGHRRFAYKYSTPMCHQLSGGSVGKMTDMEESVEQSKKIQKLIEKIILEKTKITKKKLKEIREKKFDWYMTSTEALKLGVIDEII